ncbi:metal-dependent hydrolase [Candidatus Parcubacteria bacterium]|nr:metal-dependent hydrolase [Patescibacteria group bacterium]MBU4466834.1 metal-dependent hydrolase [Patescibacteria group bacterium]MCG2688783.1 metal-dependent hydrolase [Candidatus Parcubacteria bacterium]
MFSPTHFGTGLLLGALGPAFFNFWALLAGSVAMDFENIFLVSINKITGCPNCFHHGFFHSILGAILGSLILSFVILKLKPVLEKISLSLKIKQSFPFKTLFLSSFLAWLAHIGFDSLVHRDVFLFWPIKTNPFLISWTLYWPLSFVLAAIGTVSLTILAIRMIKYKEN